MGSLLQRCQVVITNDNGPMHLAVAVGAPTVTIYGPTDPKSWNPGGPRHLALQAAGLSCLGCNLNECPFSHECMTQVTSERVFLASQKLVEFHRG
jgi:heptosyltransferase II